jgi:integrase/recombinase XerD
VNTAKKAFLRASRDRNLKESTLESYTRTLAHLVAALGDRTVASIDVATLDSYRAGRKIAARTWRKELEHLRAFFAWCLDRGWCADNPAKRLRMPRVDELATLPFSADEVARLIAACDQIETDNTPERPYIRQRSRALVYALLYSGLRISDVAKMRRAALDPATGHLTLRVTKTGVPLKVLLHADAKQSLESLASVNPEYFFWTGRGKLRTLLGNLRRTIQRLGAIAKVHAHPHRFRDTFAVELLTHGADIRTVQKLLGHESVRTTEKHYAHFVAAHQALLDSATARLDFTGGKAGRPVLMHQAKKRLGNR